MTRRGSLEDVLELHASAVREVLARSEDVADSDWHVPVADGKWSPAGILAHLVASYDVVIGELKGDRGMKVRTRFWQRLVLRFTVLPGILSGRGFPSGAVAPRETRPSGEAGKVDSIALLRRRADEFQEAVRLAPEGRGMTHAYFGTASLPDGVLLCARHVQHHSAQLPGRTPDRKKEEGSR